MLTQIIQVLFFWIFKNIFTLGFFFFFFNQSFTTKNLRKGIYLFMLLKIVFTYAFLWWYYLLFYFKNCLKTNIFFFSWYILFTWDFIWRFTWLLWIFNYRSLGLKNLASISFWWFIISYIIAVMGLIPTLWSRISWFSFIFLIRYLLFFAICFRIIIYFRSLLIILSVIFSCVLFLMSIIILKICHQWFLSINGLRVISERSGKSLFFNSLRTF